MNRKNNVAQSEDGLSFDHQEQLLVLLQQSSKQTQLLQNQMQNQNKYNLLIFLIVLVAIAIIFFFISQILNDKKNNPGQNLTLKEFTVTYDNLQKKMSEQLESMRENFASEVAIVKSKSQEEKDLLVDKVTKSYDGIIAAMEKTREESEKLRVESEKLAEKYKKQIADYEARLFVQKRQIEDVGTKIARLDNKHNSLMAKYKKLQVENKRLVKLNEELEKRLRPYLSPQEQIELERKKKKDD